ncbi:MAG: DUF2782 domain-containing protein [Gammaproteobacteria bacterium]|nr:DUF2782 domain-containing protein [Gammaproteobacteria bacterium]
MTPTQRRFIPFLLALCLAGVAAAAEPEVDEVPPPPPLPATESTDAKAPPPAEAPTPEVRVTTKNGEIYEEHRLNGQLYMVKVQPKHGPPYYLLYDEAGQMRRSEHEPDMVPPRWLIKRF